MIRALQNNLFDRTYKLFCKFNWECNLFVAVVDSIFHKAAKSYKSKKREKSAFLTLLLSMMLT